MKRILPVLFLMLTLCSCSLGREIDTSTDYSSDLKDGTYTVSSTHYDSYGYRKKLSIQVHRGIISDVSFDETTHGNELRDQLTSSKVPWQRCEYSYLQLKPILYDQTIFTQGERIDTISGATKTSDDYRIMLETALNAAKKGGPAEQSINSFSDVYIANNEVDPLTGSQEEIRVEFQDGALSSIEVRELSSSSLLRPIGNLYSSLAEISSRNKSLENIPESTVDTNILNRYNALLTQIRTARGE